MSVLERNVVDRYSQVFEDLSEVGITGRIVRDVTIFEFYEHRNRLPEAIPDYDLGCPGQADTGVTGR